jgi:apolipoprotein D and lipocalin family protein
LYIDKEYEHAIVGSKSKDYLWLLSRHYTINKEQKDMLTTKIKSLGYDINNLIYISQDLNIKSSDEK